MKKVLGFLLVAAMIAAPVSRIALIVSMGLGWLLAKQCLRELSAQQKLRPIRIRVLNQKSRRSRRN